MAATNDNSELVDLATTDKCLEDVMIREYTGRITGKQYIVDKSDLDTKVYRFFNLEKEVLLDFLEKYGLIYEYKVLKSSDGKPIVTNKVYKA